MTLKEFLTFQILSTDKITIQLWQFIFAGIIYIFTKLILFVIRRYLMRRVRQDGESGLSRQNSVFLLIKYFVWVFASMFMMEALGVDVSILLAGSAALFVGIGLGLQQMFTDIMSGIIILFEGTVKVNDVLEVDGIVGKVKEIHLRTSKIMTPDDIIIIVPNHKFINENVINWSHSNAATRFHVKVGVAYGSDTEKVKDILLSVAENHPDILPHSTHPITVAFVDFGESSLDFTLKFWTSNIFFVELIKSDLRFRINQQFMKEEIEIPFPQRVVYHREEKKSS